MADAKKASCVVVSYSSVAMKIESGAVLYGMIFARAANQKGPAGSVEIAGLLSCRCNIGKMRIICRCQPSPVPCSGSCENGKPVLP